MFKIALKQFSYTHSFCTLEQYLNQSWFMYCVTKFLIILLLVLRFYLCTLYKYSLIVYCELITFPCINLIYVLFMYCIYKVLLLLLLLFVFYCQHPFCTVPTVVIMTSSIYTLVDLWNTE
jgi:hypothetical protein